MPSGLGEIETRDTGKMFKETRWQANYIAEFFHFYAGCADKIHGDTLPIDKPDMFVFTHREPLGVIAAIVPWNSQLFLTAVKIGPALAAGNTVVLKASEHASAAMLEFGKLIAEAGIPDGVVNIVTGHGEPCGRALTSHPLVARISFTGGPGAARHVLMNSTKNFAEVSLELGGKSPFIVFEDADIESAVNGSVAGIFGASGQSCVAGSRLIVHEDVADAFLARMVEIARAVKIGDPMAEETEMGPLCTLGQLATIEREVARAGRGGRSGALWGQAGRGGRDVFRADDHRLSLARICISSIPSCLARCCRSCGFARRTRRCGWPMIPSMGWRRGFSRATGRGRCGCRGRCGPASSGSTPIGRFRRWRSSAA